MNVKMFCNENYLHIRWRSFQYSKSVRRNARTAKCWYALVYRLAYTWWKDGTSRNSIANGSYWTYYLPVQLLYTNFDEMAVFVPLGLEGQTCNSLKGMKQTFSWRMSSIFLEFTSERLWSTLTVCQRAILVLCHCGVTSNDIIFPKRR